MIFKNIEQIPVVKTSHGCGLKKVLASNDETVSAITQIAETVLKKGETAEMHSHQTMEEFFYILSGELEISVEDKVCHCAKGDFLIIRPGEKHSLKALSDCRMITVGCAFGPR